MHRISIIRYTCVLCFWRKNFYIIISILFDTDGLCLWRMTFNSLPSISQAKMNIFWSVLHTFGIYSTEQNIPGAGLKTLALYCKPFPIVHRHYSHGLALYCTFYRNFLPSAHGSSCTHTHAHTHPLLNYHSVDYKKINIYTEMKKYSIDGENFSCFFSSMN